MRTIAQSCDLQFFVCVNQRAAGAALPSCGSGRGNEVYESLRAEAVAWGRRRGLQVWVNRSLCQGFCHADGVNVSVFPLQLRFQAVLIGDLPQMFLEIENKLMGKGETRKA
ncbi:hypothetical protein EBR21_00585 [bacterium]|nr:hypothetical protein [bacterium]